MSVKNNAQLKALFENGDKPTATDFGDLIDTITDGNAFSASTASAPADWDASYGPTDLGASADITSSQIVLTRKSLVVFSVDVGVVSAGNVKVEMSILEDIGGPVSNAYSQATIPPGGASESFVNMSFARILPAGSYRARLRQLSAATPTWYRYSAVSIFVD